MVRELRLAAGVTLFTERWGSGPPLLLIHGLGASARYWLALAPFLEGWSVVAPDLLGFGRSPAPADDPYDLDSHVRRLAAVLPGGAVVVGHSTGAVLAAGLAAHYPTGVRSLVLVGAPAFPDSPTAREWIGRYGLMAKLTVEGSPWAARLCSAMCRVRPLAAAVAPILVRDLPHEIAADGARHTWPSYSRTLQRIVVETRLSELLAQGRRPTVFLHGSEDATAPSTLVQAAAAEAAGSGLPVRAKVVPGDHHLAVRQPELVAGVVGEER